MQRVFVLDNEKQPLSPCAPARARHLLRDGKAAVYRRYPFTIIMKHRTGGEVQPLELKLDPGSKTTGIALVQKNKAGVRVVWAAELVHRGLQIKKALDARRAIRRSRRNRKTRYRQPRFLNRTKPQGWLPPSLLSRVGNVTTWGKRLQRFAPLCSVAVETVKFDLQKAENPMISGVEYQHGTLFGYEVREYLLEKWNRVCSYCGKKNVPLEIEHIVAKVNGGTNRVSNLTLSCLDCNQKKGSQPVEVFLKNKPHVLLKLLTQQKRPVKDTAAVNATRYAIGNALKALRLPVTFWSGGRTKFNRTQQNYPKKHWIDAACVGETGRNVCLIPQQRPFVITATGRGTRQMCRMDRFGFPRTGAKGAKTVQGFRTGDIVQASVPSGKKSGVHTGRVAVRTSGSFNITTVAGTVQGIPYRYCSLLYRADGYGYSSPTSAKRPIDVPAPV
ncbi:MAG: HNH endonuclease [Desulfofustis sp.]|nr:HNH endonuclease [Desulfofustis sp.]